MRESLIQDYAYYFKTTFAIFELSKFCYMLNSL